MDQLARGLEQVDQGGVGLFDVLSGNLGHVFGEVAPGVDRVDQSFDACGLQGEKVDFSIGGRHVNQPCSLVNRDFIGRDGAEGSGFPTVGEVVERWLVGHTQEVGAFDPGNGLAPVAEYRFDPIGGDPVVVAPVGNSQVLDALAYRHSQVAGQCPWRRRPDQQVVAGMGRPVALHNGQAHRDRRVLDIPVIEVRLEVGKWSGGAP